MARRNLSRSRGKSATTLLVMLVGVFSVALVIILASSLKDTIKESLEKSFGYNVQVSVKDDAQTVAIQQAVDTQQVPGLEKSVAFSSSSMRLVSGGGLSAEQLIARKLEYDKTQTNSGFDSTELTSLVGFSTKDISTVVKITEGQLYQDDNQVILDKAVKDPYGLKVGDQLVYRDLQGSQQYTLTVTGFFEKKNMLLGLGTAMTTYTRLQTVVGHQNGFEFNFTRDRLNEGLKYLDTTFPGSDVTDLSIITTVINRIIDNVTAFPILLALLSLIAGAVLIANNVALAVLERRTEMGVMKSIGADNNRVLAIISWETIIVGFLGGLFGFMLASSIGFYLIGLMGTEDNPAVLTISPLVFIGMLALAVGLAVVATVGSAWGASREKPLVVLRYE